MIDLSADGALIATNIETVKERIAAACARRGRAFFGRRALPDDHYWPGLGGSREKDPL